MFQIQVHGDDLTSLYEQVPKEVLPIEYGGKAGTLAENWGELNIMTKMKLYNFTAGLFNAFGKCTSKYY